MYVCVCVYVLIGWMDGWMDGWVGGWMDGWMGVFINLFCMHACTYVCVYEYMCVCVLKGTFCAYTDTHANCLYGSPLCQEATPPLEWHLLL